jgi:hypothetical protein
VARIREQRIEQCRRYQVGPKVTNAAPGPQQITYYFMGCGHLFPLLAVLERMLQPTGFRSDGDQFIRPTPPYSHPARMPRGDSACIAGTPVHPPARSACLTRERAGHGIDPALQKHYSLTIY